MLSWYNFSVVIKEIDYTVIKDVLFFYDNRSKNISRKTNDQNYRN